MSLILASGSPRRRELLGLITKDFTVRVSDVEEVVEPGLPPAETVRRLAALKGRAVAAAYPQDTVIAADTVVAIDGEILGKPHDDADAAAMLRTLSGRVHHVYTGVFLSRRGREICFSACTEVEFYPLTDEEIAAYVATGEPSDKAGAYGIQGFGALLVKGIVGDYYNVVGFPVAAVSRALRALVD